MFGCEVFLLLRCTFARKKNSIDLFEKASVAQKKRDTTRCVSSTLRNDLLWEPSRVLFGDRLGVRETKGEVLRKAGEEPPNTIWGVLSQGKLVKGV